MNMLTDIYRNSKRIQWLARSQIGQWIPRDFSYFDEQSLHEEASKIFPILETCRRIWKIHAQKSAEYRQTNDATLIAIDTWGITPVIDTIKDLLKK